MCVEIQPVVGDRRLGRVHDRLAVHEGRRTECRFARQAGVEKGAARRSDVLRHRCRQLHEEVVRMLPVDQPVESIGSFTAREKKRIAARPHQRVGAEHRPELERAFAERAAGHAHEHPSGERLVVAARSGLVIVDKVERAVRHEHPVAALGHHHAQGCRRIGLPRRPRTFALRRIGSERSDHRHCVAAGPTHGHCNAAHLRMTHWSRRIRFSWHVHCALLRRHVHAIH